MFGISANGSRREALRLMSHASSQKSQAPPSISQVSFNSTDFLILNSPSQPKSFHSADKNSRGSVSSSAQDLKRQTKHKKGHISGLKKPPESQLIQRAEANDPTVSMVLPDTSLQIDIPPGQEHTFFTHALGGCSSALLQSKYPNGARKSTMGHFSPLGFLERKKSFEKKIKQHGSLSDHQLVIVLPGERKQAFDNHTEIVPLPEALVDPLRNCVQSQLRDKVQEITEPYNLLRQPGASNAFIVQYPRNLLKQVRYDVCGEKAGHLK